MGRQELLPALFGKIRIPRTVLLELSAGAAPAEAGCGREGGTGIGLRNRGGAGVDR